MSSMSAPGNNASTQAMSGRAITTSLDLCRLSTATQMLASTAQKRTYTPPGPTRKIHSTFIPTSRLPTESRASYHFFHAGVCQIICGTFRSGPCREAPLENCLFACATCDNGIEEEAITKLQEACDSSEQKDECTVRLNDLEGAYWMGTEMGQLGAYGFQGVTLGVDGSCKDGRMGSGCCTFGGKDEGKCARVGREDEGVSSNRPELGAVVLALQSVGLNEDALLLCDNEAVLCVIRKWVGHGGESDVSHSDRCGHFTGDNLPANAACAGRESDLPDKSEVASWRAD